MSEGKVDVRSDQAIIDEYNAAFLRFQTAANALGIARQEYEDASKAFQALNRSRANELGFAVVLARSTARVLVPILRDTAKRVDDVGTNIGREA